MAPTTREQIAEQIKSEIALQVKNEVDNQISAHLPTPLAIQAAEVIISNVQNTTF